MATYDRANNLPSEVAELQKTVKDIKQSQIIGNDNLVVYLKSAPLMPAQSLLANTPAVIKMTFTFDSQSTSYVIPRIQFSLTGGVAYNQNFYADPSTIDNLNSRSWYYVITPASNTTLFMSFNAYCTDSGTASIVRIS